MPPIRFASSSSSPACAWADVARRAATRPKAQAQPGPCCPPMQHAWVETAAALIVYSYDGVIDRGLSFTRGKLDTSHFLILLRFRMGCHSLPIVCGRRSGTTRPQRLCPHCASNAAGDERHMLFDCEALQTTRENFADLFGPAIVTMQQFMWQGDRIFCGP